jgi:N-acetylglucosamine-6-phosphate deacetylase
MTAQFLQGCDVLTDQGVRAGLGLLVRHGRIEAVLPETDLVAVDRIALPPKTLLAAGFIDVQVNGGGGILFNDHPTAQAALAIAAAHRTLGTTAILPTLITSDPATMRAAAAAARPAVAAGQGVLGIHFEGPFLSPARPGVHRPDLIRAPDDADLALLESVATHWDGKVVLTLAPECVPQVAQDRLAAAGIILSAGHSAAPFDTVRPPITGITHLFNAMNPPTARDPGLVAAALLGDFFTGIIMDFIHVHPAMLRLLLAVKHANRIMLVSDSMSVAGTDLAEFLLQGRHIIRRNGRLETAGGVLAGADLSLAQAVRNAMQVLGLDAAQAIAMATEVPAAFLGLSAERGRIAPGLRADLVLLSPGMEVLGTFLAGAWRGEPGVLPAGHVTA